MDAGSIRHVAAVSGKDDREIPVSEKKPSGAESTEHKIFSDSIRGPVEVPDFEQKISKSLPDKIRQRAIKVKIAVSRYFGSFPRLKKMMSVCGKIKELWKNLSQHSTPSVSPSSSSSDFSHSFSRLSKSSQSTDDIEREELLPPEQQETLDKVVEVGGKIRKFAEEKLTTKLDEKRGVLAFLKGTIKDQFRGVLNRARWFEQSLWNVTEKIRQKIMNPKEGEKVFNTVEGTVVGKLTKHLHAVNNTSENHQLEPSDLSPKRDALILQEMEQQNALPEAICVLTVEEEELLAEKDRLVRVGESCQNAIERHYEHLRYALDEQKTEIEEKIGYLKKIAEIEQRVLEQETKSARKICETLVDKLIFPEGVKDDTLGELREIFNEVHDGFESELLAIQQKIYNFVSEGKDISKLQELANNRKEWIHYLEHLISLAHERDIMIELMTRVLMTKADQASEPLNMYKQLAKVFEKKSTEGVPLEKLLLMEEDPLYHALFSESLNTILPGAREPIEAIQSTVGKVGDVAAVTLAVMPGDETFNEFDSYTEQGTEATKEDQGWFGWIGGKVVDVTKSAVGYVKNVRDTAANVFASSQRFTMLSRRMKYAVGSIKVRVMSTFNEKYMQQKLDEFINIIDQNSTNKKEEIPAQTLNETRERAKNAVKKQMEKAEAIRGTSAAFGLSILALTPEKDAVIEAMDKDRDYGHFVDRMAGSKRLNKVLFYQMLEGTMAGLEKGEFFESPDNA